MNYTNILIDDVGLPRYTSSNIIEMLYRGQHNLVSEIYADSNDPEILKFNQVSQELGEDTLQLYNPIPVSIEEFDKICQSDWLMPDEYKQLDIAQWLIDQTTVNSVEYFRVCEELIAYEDHNMINLLRWLKYFVDTCRQKNVVWGVGRGSSVSSYVLYLIGVSKIDPIKYNLDWRDFLR